ncbi:MAG TPA: ComEA family DNA-binding protein [Anaerolineaceae bacterium]|jgi:competence protein ComEA|nr:ComEA family DNA-binding protein [Anaerolineaceae bacterium]NMD27677.1 ComEA family DNA-binding protein [Chloroflexota bacterium]HOA20890.1 ComEA family DNA-binding protein [Anaerolineaceae bacterium]HOG76661.1 ComEA family DNA-binding protein [Anaerolineaceae bacterium]
MKTWQAVFLGFIGGLLLSGAILLLILPQRGEPIQLVTITPDIRTQATATAALIEVHVAGAVANAGVYTLPTGARVHQALSAAGGALADADFERINLSAYLADGQRVYMPRIGEAVPQDNTARSSTGIAAPDSLININSADKQALMSLPGIGESKAEAILSYRAEHGPFTNLNELLNVPGIGQAILDEISGLIVLGP